MRSAFLLAVAGGILLPSVTLSAQDRGPTVAAARSAIAMRSVAVQDFRNTTMASVAARAAPNTTMAPASCGSLLKNAALLGLGLSLATATIELTYTIVREPFVRNGHDMAAADPRLIAWAGGAGFVVGLIGTEVCRRRRR